MENPDGIFGLNQQRGGNLVIVNLFQNKGLNKTMEGLMIKMSDFRHGNIWLKEDIFFNLMHFQLVLVNRVQNFMSKKPKDSNKEVQYERSFLIPELSSKRKNSTISGWRSELLEKRGERCKLDPTRKVCFSLDRRKSSQREYCIPVELKSTQKKEKVFSV